MNLSRVATRALGSSELFLKRNAPHILTGAGIVGFAATTALAIRATNQAVPVIEDISKDIALVKKENEVSEGTEKEKMEELVRVYARSSVTLLKVYWPVFAAGSASIVLVLAGHNMMAKRQASLLAAYTGLDAAYKAYRARVAERWGEKEERILYDDVRKMRIFDDENDKEGCEIIDMSDIMPSVYARFFDETSTYWSRTPEYNMMFLRTQQQWATDKLHAQGHLFLNEVYDALGMERSQAGQIVGWKLKGTSEDYVDFGLYDIADENNRAFVNIVEGVVKVDFNVDGVITI